MSRRSKRNRNLKKLKLRNSTRVSLVMFSFLVFAISSTNFIKSLSINDSTKTEEDVYTYKNEYNIDYDVNIIGNSFVEEKTLPSGQSYVSDLVKSFDMNIKYKYSGSKDLDINYNYKIDAIIGASYTENGKQYSIWNKTYNLVKKDDLHSNGDVNLDENVVVDYQKYHQEVKNFKQSFGMTLDSYLYIKLTVDTETTINHQEVKNQYVSDFSVTLGDKVAIVNGKDSDTKANSIKHESTINKTTVNMPKLIFSVITMAICVYIIYYIRFKTKKYNTVRNEFKLELNRILKSCQDRIVIVKNNNISEEENIIDVNDFGELIKLSEELYKPILCWISEDLNKEEACFSIISGKIRYKFVLKNKK